MTEKTLVDRRLTPAFTGSGARVPARIQLITIHFPRNELRPALYTKGQFPQERYVKRSGARERKSPSARID